MRPALYMARNRNIDTLMQVAQGIQPADRVLRNARLVNVYSGEILDDYAIGIAGEWIAWVAPQKLAPVDAAHTVQDLEGKTVIPGWIEGHTHLLSTATVYEYLRYLIPGGTTTIITECTEAYPAMGLEGVLAFLAALADQPIKILATAPAMVSTSPLTSGIALADLETLLARSDIVGLGETYWQALFQKHTHKQMLAQVQMARASGKCLEGHSAGAGGHKLLGYAAAGISSCHEPINVDEVLSRLRQGIYVMIREGSIRRDLEAIAEILNSHVDTRRLILATDGVNPSDLIEKGGLEYVVQKAIDCGFAPVTAIQMATLNVAEHFGLEDIAGGIAPGRYADLVIVPDCQTVTRPAEVISRGRTVALDGKLVVLPRRHVFPASVYQSIRLPKTFRATDFVIPTPPNCETLDVKIIVMITDLVTQAAVESMPVQQGEIVSDPAGDILKIAALDCTHDTGKCFTGLIKGFGLRRGALASSGAWDTANTVVVGANDADMAMAVNRVGELHGGVVVCDGGRILAELAMPVFGVVADAPLETVAQHVATLHTTIAELGVRLPDPLLTLLTLTGAAIPFLRICESGLVNLRSGELEALQA